MQKQMGILLYKSIKLLISLSYLEQLYISYLQYRKNLNQNFMESNNYKLDKFCSYMSFYLLTNLNCVTRFDMEH